MRESTFGLHTQYSPEHDDIQDKGHRYWARAERFELGTLMIGTAAL